MLVCSLSWDLNIRNPQKGKNVLISTILNLIVELSASKTAIHNQTSLSSTRDPELVKRIGAATALEVRATGIPYVFAPCIAVTKLYTTNSCYQCTRHFK